MKTMNALYRTERLRAVRDLLVRVPKISAAQPKIIDVGCGEGAATNLLFDRFPTSSLTCLDPDASRLEAARSDEVLASRSSVAFKCASAEEHFADSAGKGGPLYDLIFANASLHWCEDVPDLLARMLGRLHPGGYLAVQVPENQGHREIFKAAAADARLSESDLIVPTMVADPAAYADALLGARCSSLDMWETTYVHCLQGSEDAAFHFMSTTYDGRKVLGDSFEGDADGAQAFSEAYRRRVAAAYPPARDGKTTLFPFKRFFLVARRPGVLESLL